MTIAPKFVLAGVAQFAFALVLASAGATFGSSAASAATTAPAARTPQAIECSKQADAKGLHGKPREVFRAECKRQAKATQAVPMPAPAKAAY